VITVANLTHAINDADLSSYDTASISPAPASLVFLWLHTANYTALPSSITGAGLTWTLLQTLTTNSVGPVVWGGLYVATTSGAPSSGIITVAFAAGQTGLGWAINQVSSSYGLPFVQQSTILTPATSNPTMTLSPAPSMDSVVLGFIARPDKTLPVYSVGAGFISLGLDASNEKNLAAEYVIGPASGVVNFGGANNFDNKLAVAEVREPSGGWGTYIL